MEILIKLFLFIILAVVGYWRGRRNQIKHLRELAQEEKAHRDVLVFATRYPDTNQGVLDPFLVAGNAVVSADYFRYFVATLRKFLGGRYTVYEQLNDIARRQAVVRMKQEAKAQGANMIFNVRVNTSRISHAREGGTPQVEVMAYGTAFVHARGSVCDSAVHYQKPPQHSERNQHYEMLHHPFPRAWLIGWFISVIIVIGFFMAYPWYYVNLSTMTLCMIPLSALLTFYLFQRGKKVGVPPVQRRQLAILTLPTFVFLMHYFMLALQVNVSSHTQTVKYEWRGEKTLFPMDEGGWPEIDVIPLHLNYWKSLPNRTPVELDIRKNIFGDYFW